MRSVRQQSHPVLRPAARILLLGLLGLFIGCTHTGTYRTYLGEPRSEMQVAILEGEQYLRQDWLNRYVDSVRFSRIDERLIERNEEVRSLEVAPGYHEFTVFFYWDMGSEGGLSQALVQYAASKETMSRTFRFNARAGEHYTVKADPVFDGARREITNLLYVDFWVEDSAGNHIVSRSQGAYAPSGD